MTAGCVPVQRQVEDEYASSAVVMSSNPGVSDQNSFTSLL